ncbi:MAG: hypothetical protein IJE50_02980, partial [Clostridia bacterium]|nr:hypothetical protein [Clostridia bacterium]
QVMPVTLNFVFIFPRGIVADYILIYYYSTKIYTNATVWKNLHAKLGKICTKKEQPWGKLPKRLLNLSQKFDTKVSKVLLLRQSTLIDIVCKWFTQAFALQIATLAHYAKNACGNRWQSLATTRGCLARR